MNSLTAVINGPTRAEEVDPVLASEPSRGLDCPTPRLGFSGTVLTGVVSPSTSSGTAEHGALGLLICDSAKLIYPY